MEKRSLVKKFLNNKCDSREADIISQLLRKEPHLLDEIISEDEWDRHLAQYDDQGYDTDRFGWIKTLVTCLVISMLGIFYAGGDRMRTSDPIVSMDNTLHINHADTIAEITLQDGSVVNLYPRSVFYTAVNAREPIRFIRLLSGEMYVVVHKNKYKPFVAQSGYTQVTALGTEFTLKYEVAEQRSYVALHEGKLKVELKDTQPEKLILLPGEYFKHTENNTSQETEYAVATSKLPTASGDHQKVYVRPSSITINENRIEMHNTTLSEALTFISQELDMPIAYAERDVENHHISGVFIVPANKMDLNTKEAKALEILDIITKVNPLIITQKHNTNILLNKY